MSLNGTYRFRIIAPYSQFAWFHIQSLLMCGRFTLTHEIADIGEVPSFSKAGIEHKPRYNIAPRQFTYVVISRHGVREIKLMRWGLIPSWAKDEKIAAKTINARSETLGERLFKQAFKSRRCLVLADGFYEWQKSKAGRTPHYIYLKGNPIFSFAGLWDSWSNTSGDDRLVTFSIVTTNPNSLMNELHNRMPVILKPDDEEAWLAKETDPTHLQRMFEPYPAENMQSHIVGNAVGNVANEGSGLTTPARLLF